MTSPLQTLSKYDKISVLDVHLPQSVSWDKILPELWDVARMEFMRMETNLKG